MADGGGRIRYRTSRTLETQGLRLWQSGHGCHRSPTLGRFQVQPSAAFRVRHSFAAFRHPPSDPIPFSSTSAYLYTHVLRPVLALARAAALAPEGSRDRRRALLPSGGLPMDGGGGHAVVDRVVDAPRRPAQAPGDARGGLRAGAAVPRGLEPGS